jgi:hypothetical protein
MPSPHEKVQAGDLLVLHGSLRDLEVLEGLQELRIEKQTSSLVAELESQQIGVTEVLLSPRCTLVGKTLSDLLFRDHYGVSVLAIWRKGSAYRTGLQDMPLQFGDALLVYGQRRNLEAVARDSNFIVLDEAAARAPRLEKARIAAVIMLAVLLSAILGFVPIAIAALTGSALMVLVGCLSMEEAYRAIEWKVVFLIAGMLPLGAAIANTGAAHLGAMALIAAVGELGPRWVVAALFVVTVIGTQVIPTAALVVLMTPVALSAAADLGISPHLLMMTVAISASASFASPLSHPAHMLVMSPGGVPVHRLCEGRPAVNHCRVRRCGGAAAGALAPLGETHGLTTCTGTDDLRITLCAICPKSTSFPLWPRLLRTIISAFTSSAILRISSTGSPMTRRSFRNGQALSCSSQMRSSCLRAFSISQSLNLFNCSTLG